MTDQSKTHRGKHGYGQARAKEIKAERIAQKQQVSVTPSSAESA
ncbi:MAG: hypothetical protein AAGJ10_14415 [Bacteroidota bacterium]